MNETYEFFFFLNGISNMVLASAVSTAADEKPSSNR